VNSFSVKTGTLYERLKEIEKTMSESDVILLNRKMSLIESTTAWLANARANDRK